ncbi:MAG TPA: hypothetical protein VGX28_00035 [Frankiaceae bacterium]|nr:hypothetical protein [Frankiaceae bacterium]
MHLETTEALLRLLDRASALAEARDASRVALDDLRRAAEALAEGYEPVPWARLRLADGLVLHEAATVAYARGDTTLDVADVLAVAGVDPTTATAAAGTLARSLVEDPPSTVHRRASLIDVLSPAQH